MSKQMMILIGALAVVAIVVVVVFVAAPSTNPDDAEAATDPLLGTRWQVRSYYDAAQGGLVSPLPDTELTAEFTAGEGAEGSKVGGSAGCNEYRAGYTVDGNSLSLGVVASTRMFCAGLMDQEMAFMSAMESASSFELGGGELRILNDQGEAVVELVSAP